MTHKGSSLEAAVIASQLRAVRLTQVRGEVLRVTGGRMVQKRGPVDFMGALVPSGRAIVFDAKVCKNPRRLEAHEDHLPAHQRLQIILYGEAGAVAGILAENTDVGAYYWLRWQALKDNAPSYPWNHEGMFFVGDNRRLIDWGRVVEVAEGDASEERSE